MRMYGPLKKQKLRAFATTLTLKKPPLKPLKKPCEVLTLELKYSSGSGSGRTKAGGSVVSLHGSSDGGLRVALSKAHNVMTMRRREQARLALIEMENSVVVEDKFESFKELERLCGCKVGFGGGFQLDWLGLGLRRKDDDDDMEE